MTVRPRAGLPAIPFIRRRQKTSRKIPRDGTVWVVHDQLRGKRGPTIWVKHASADKFHEPGPVGSFIVISRDVKAQPCAPVGHVAFEGFALRLAVRKFVKPNDQLVRL